MSGNIDRALYFRAPGQLFRDEEDAMAGKSDTEKHGGGLLHAITEMLDNGLQTQVEPFPKTNTEFSEILLELRQLPPDALKERLIIGGLVNHPWGAEQQRCMECMYYLVHRRWCDLPELSIPVEPEWWCRLWRI